MNPPVHLKTRLRTLCVLAGLAAAAARGGGVYDDFVRMAASGVRPGAVCGSLAARLDKPEGLSPVEIMDGTACLVLYGTAMENKDLAAEYLARYRKLPERRHDRVLAGDGIESPCGDCRGAGSTTADCPTCQGGFITTKTTLARRRCPGCRGVGSITSACPACGGDGRLFNRDLAVEAFQRFVRDTLLQRAGADAPRFVASLDPANREAFIHLYLKSLLTEEPVAGRVVGVPDADRVLFLNSSTKELCCLHFPGHGLAVDAELSRKAYKSDPWSGRGPSGAIQVVPGYTTEVLEAAVLAIGHDQVLDLYAKPERSK